MNISEVIWVLNGVCNCSISVNLEWELCISLVQEIENQL